MGMGAHRPFRTPWYAGVQEHRTTSEAVLLGVSNRLGYEEKALYQTLENSASKLKS